MSQKRFKPVLCGVTASNAAPPRSRFVSEPSQTRPILGFTEEDNRHIMCVCVKLIQLSEVRLRNCINQIFYFVYILFSLKDKKLYIGYSKNLTKRLQEHLKGHVHATQRRLPLILIYYEVFTDKKDAKTRERFLKSGFGRSQLKKSLKNRLKQLNYKHL